MHEPDVSEAVKYDYDAFPPNGLDAQKLLDPLSSAVASITRYDVLLGQMRDSELLLAPLRRQEAVVSSRMEGTITTLEEVLTLEADQDPEKDIDVGRHRPDAIETLSYARALRLAQYRMKAGQKISESLIKSIHHELLRPGRGYNLDPGRYKIEQNYLADRAKRTILYVPISPEQLAPHMERLVQYIESSTDHPLIKAAISHVEFEALHPFNDGNGRMGRMLITLYLWQSGLISAPHFYVSEYFEINRDEYIDRMRAVSSHNAWTEWVIFFLNALREQAILKCGEIERIQLLYEEMQSRFRDALSSKDFLTAANFMFENVIFRSTQFAVQTGISKPTVNRFLKVLTEGEILRIVRPASGRRPALYAFQPLLQALHG